MDEHGNLSGLMERAKELACLYLIDEALTKEKLSDILMQISAVTPSGFRNEKACSVTVVLDGKSYTAGPDISDVCEIRSDIIINGKIRGYIRAAYPKNTFAEGELVFLPQEHKLLQAIADKISLIVYQKNHRDKSNWMTILNLLQKTNQAMLLHICEKMLALIATKNPKLAEGIYSEMDWTAHKYHGEINYPLEQLPAMDVMVLSDSLFTIASACFDDEQIFDYIMLWIYQRETYELIKIVNRKHSNVDDISKALVRYINAVKINKMNNEATQRWLFVELIRHFLTDAPKLINHFRKYISVEDFCDLMDSFVCSPQSAGKIGGKATGFFIANQIIKAHASQFPEFKNIRITKTWYIPSDEMENLLYDNGLEELNEHKYKDILEQRILYPKIIQTIKSARLSSYIMNQLNRILEECEDKPLIIRSSSLLEDHLNSAFSGKYKSLFVTNTGTKAQRLKMLADGILEVYASMYNPDSIQYRKERNLLDYIEQMGIMIQEVVGCRVGPYYFPLYAGVAFSNNELRWSPRINREDGLIRMVMGLGTRAVDRVGDDYPILISPGQSKLSVNQAPEEMRRYSPQMLDAIDMENNRFVTIPINRLIKEYGNAIPNPGHVLSVFRNDLISAPNLLTDFKNDEFIVSFDGLINKTDGIRQIKSLLMLLKEKLGYPVDIEFANDGEYFYLLQCRPQSKGNESTSVAIPANINYQDIVFTANKYISNGKVTGIKTVIYVDPDEYTGLESRQDLLNVANAVSELNRILPRRSFILMGPGRWGSRGDIKLGVQVTYSDINNTAMMIEVAQKKSKYQPELSFGTHFFQDLVEADIKYLPLYPDDEDTVFRSSFFSQNVNGLGDILPAYAYLGNVIKVINIPQIYFGKELVVLMNADLGKAVAYLKQNEDPGQEDVYTENTEDKGGDNENQGWKWRHYMAEKIAARMDFKQYSVKGVYLFGSTNTCTARLNSDIDLLIHFDGTEEQKRELDIWLSGWSKALSEINYLKTGYKTDGLLDVHYVTDKDIENRDSYAIKIDSVYDPATPLRVRE